jgi:hypothetical protein
MPTMRCRQGDGHDRVMFPVPTIHSDLAHGRQADLIARAERRSLPPDTPRTAAPRSHVRRSSSARRLRPAPKEATTLPHTAAIDPTPRELAFRADDGVEVSLVWSALEDRLTVIVSESRSGERFELDAERENALDVFYHPYAHAARQAAA